MHIVCNFVAITVFFNESSYSVVESTEVVQPVLMLSDASSTDITVNISYSDDSTIGECQTTGKYVIVIITIT